MSAYTNGLAFWKHFEEKQGAIINCLKAEQYEELKCETKLDHECDFTAYVAKGDSGHGSNQK